jgi:hypothetical protein
MCAGRTLRPAKRCDGKGACQAANDVSCNPFRCDPATTTCCTQGNCP